MRFRLQVPLFFISLAFFLLGASRYFLRPRYSECLVDSAFLAGLADTRSEDKTLLPDLWFGEEKLFCDEKTGTYYYSLIEGDKNAFDPVVGLSKSGKVDVGFTEQITDESLKSNHAIPFVIYTNESFCRCQLSCTTLPLITIACDSDINKETTYDMYFSLFDNRKDALQRVTNSEGTIHTRGVTSSAFPKYGLKISLKMKSLGGNLRSNPQSLLGMRQDDDWILYAGYNDPEKIRNVFSMKLWHDSCAMDNRFNRFLGTEYKYVEVLLNGRYQGLYAICPPIDEKQVGLNGNLQEQALYKFGDFVGDELIRNEFGGIESVLVKHTPTSRTDDGNPIYIESDYELLTQYYDGFREHNNDLDYLRQGIDLDNALDFYLFIDLILGSDNMEADTITNMYLVLQKEKERLIGMFCPWDLDMSWGNEFNGDESLNFTNVYGLQPDDHCFISCGYFYRLLKLNPQEYEGLLKERYLTLRESSWDNEHIMKLIDRYEADIYDSGAYQRDMERWPEGTFSNPEEKLSRFRRFVSDRLEALDSFYGDAWSRIMN